MFSLRRLLLGAALLRASAAVALDPARAVSEYALDVWKEDLPQKTVLALLQTKDGHLCVGTYEGVALFDGQRFEVVDERTTPALRSRGVRTLAQDAQGTLWIGTINGGLVRFRDGVYTSFTTAAGLANDAVNIVACGRDGYVWVATEGGVSRFRNGRFTTFGTKDGLSSPIVRGLAIGPDGTIWAGTDAGLDRLDGDRFVSVPLPGESPHVVAVTVARDGTVWAGTLGSGLYRLRGEQVTRFSPESGFPATTVPAILEDAHGGVWVASYQGLFRMKGDGFESLDARRGLPDGSLRSLAEDREGSLWIGTNNGLARLKDLKFVNYGAKSGLSEENVRVVAESRGGGLWVGTYGGGLNLLKDGKVTVLGAREGISDAFVRSIAEGPDGTVWVGTLTHGVFRMRDGRVTELGLKDGLVGTTVNALIALRDGPVVVGTQPGGLDILAGGRFEPLLADSSPVTQVRALLEARDGTLWVGTSNNGLLAVRGRKVVKTIGALDGLPANVFAVHEDADRALWIGTQGGLCRLAEETLACVTMKSGLPDDTVFQVLEDAKGSLWLTSNRGLTRLAKENVVEFLEGRRARIEAVTFRKADGLGSNQCNGASQPAGITLRDGRLAIPTAGGLTIVDPENLHPNEVPPPVAISEVLVDGASVAVVDGAELPWSSRRFEFRYAGFSLLVPELVTFRYRIDGLDEDWIDAGSRRAAFYNSIPPGRHAFRVKARNNDGVWSEREASFSFTLPAPPWGRWWALVAYAALVAAGIAGAVRVRERVLRTRNRLLEDRISSRTSELAEALRRVEASEAVAVEANRAKSVFLANMSHELRTPLNAVLGFAQLLERDRAIGGESREGIRIIRRSGEHLLGLINDVLSLSKIESGKLSITEKAFDLHELVRSVASLSRPRAAAKGLEVRLELVPGLPRGVVGDAGKLRQVLINLVGNAVKFTAEGHVVLRAAREGGNVAFAVEDTGPGIGAPELAGLFEPFFQTETGRAAREGTGLGLAISREIVRLMGGDLLVESERGRGTTFRFTVPLAVSEEAPPLSASAIRRPVGLVSGQPAPKVLVVDDTPENRLLLTSLLRSAGFSVVEAKNGAEAVEAWEREHPDLVFMDMRMPVMDGREATRRIRAAEAATGGRTPIIALTASAFEHERDEVLASGADDFVAKPFRVDEILEKVGARIGARYRYEDEPAFSPLPESLPRLPGVDVAAGLARTGGNTRLYRRLLGDFALGLHQTNARLGILLDEEREPEARELLHGVKGSAATLGFTRVAAAAGTVEEALKRDPGTRPPLEELFAAADEAGAACASLAEGEPGAPSEDAPPPDPARARGAIEVAKRLAAHLDASNLAATADVAELRAALGASFASEVHALEACVDRLDFARASRLLARLEKALAAAAGSAA